MWIESFCHGWVRAGELKRWLEAPPTGTGSIDGISISSRSVAHELLSTTTYDDWLMNTVRAHDLDAEQLAEKIQIEDARQASALLGDTPVRVSLALDPRLARDGMDLAEEAERIYSEANLPRLTITLPVATLAGVQAIRSVTSRGISVRARGVFSFRRMDEVLDSYFSGLEQAPVDSVSFFLEVPLQPLEWMMDVLLRDRARSAIESDEQERLQGLASRIGSCLQMEFQHRFQQALSTERWKALAGRGAVAPKILFRKIRLGTDAPRARELNASFCPDDVLAALERSGIALEATARLLEDEELNRLGNAWNRLINTCGKKRRELTGDRLNRMTFCLPAELKPIVDSHVADWVENEKVHAFWDRDASLWSGSGENEWMGWLTIALRERVHVPEYESFAAELKSEGIQDAVVLGMGGSSLCARVFADLFSGRTNGLRLHVLDSSHPEVIRELEAKIDLSQTVFVVSSKSGTTMEPDILLRYFWQKVPVEIRSSRFIAITDPGTKLEREAKILRFRRVFSGDPEIGGRYSALSAFGLVPAALAGVPLSSLLAGVDEMTRFCEPGNPAGENPGILLGIILGLAAKHGRDKLTFLSSPATRVFDPWLEQLLAESTGKNGTGIIPVATDSRTHLVPENFSRDRIFVQMKIKDEKIDPQLEQNLVRLEESGCAVIRIVWESPEDVGQEMFRWEMAVAAAGSILGIDPFNQPNVEESKDQTRKLIAMMEQEGEPRISLSVPRMQGKPEELSHFFKKLRNHDYLTVLSYLPDSDPEVQKQLEEIRVKLASAFNQPVLVQTGPRYLHSTGQLFKGGANSGVFLFLTGAIEEDLGIPGRASSFGTVLGAQARGDLEVLIRKGRRVGLIQFAAGNPGERLKELSHSLDQALSSNGEQKLAAA